MIDSSRRVKHKMVTEKETSQENHLWDFGPLLFQEEFPQAVPLHSAAHQHHPSSQFSLLINSRRKKMLQ